MRNGTVEDSWAAAGCRKTSTTRPAATWIAGLLAVSTLDMLAVEILDDSLSRPTTTLLPELLQRPARTSATHSACPSTTPSADLRQHGRCDIGQRPRRNLGQRPRRDLSQHPRRGLGQRPRRDLGQRRRRCDVGQRTPSSAGGEASPTIGDALTAGAPVKTGQGRLVATPDLCNSCSTR